MSLTELAIAIGSLLVGALISWLIQHAYYRRSSAEMPEWANNAPEWAIPLIESLPDQPVSIDRLVELYQDALEAR